MTTYPQALELCVSAEVWHPDRGSAFNSVLQIGLNQAHPQAVRGAIWHLLHPTEVQGWLKGGIHQGVAILRKHDASAGACSGGGGVVGRLMGGPAEAQTAEEAAEGAAHLSIAAGVHHSVDQGVGLGQEQEILLHS